MLRNEDFVKTKAKELDRLFCTIDTDIANSLSFVRKAQNLSYLDVANKLNGVNHTTLRRYMQPSYTNMRPLHIVAALSWAMMVPMSSFYSLLKGKETYRGMDDDAIKALQLVGLLSEVQFKLYIDLIESVLDEVSLSEFRDKRAVIESEYCITQTIDDLHLPNSFTIDSFAIDYYRSIAITLKRFRLEHGVKEKNLANLMGLTVEQYLQLEDETTTTDFPSSIGFRLKLAFQLYSHVNFTSEMITYPQFHELRKVQHIRESLILESYKLLTKGQKKAIINILINISAL